MPPRTAGYQQSMLPEVLSAGGQSLDDLRSEAATCEACDLYKLGTQTVFGEGPENADLMLMGEVPGDLEDKAGHPFVGPAGKLLDRALVEAEIDRGNVYVTNAVKHFKWKPQGKVRLHQKPNAKEIGACRQWWTQELAVVKPKVLCCLGATAAQAVFGAKFRVTKQRGEFLELVDGVQGTATIHPSAILRADDERREVEYQDFVDDEVADDRERRRPPRFDGDRVAVVELAHVQLAGGGAALGTVRPTVDHHGARAADALAAVVVEGDGLLARGDEPLIEHVEQLEERHVGADVVDVVVLEAAPVVGSGLAPDAEV